MIPTSFSQLVGNEFVKNCLERMIDKEAIGHALLFAGPDGVGKGLFAQVVAALLMSKDDQAEGYRKKIEKGIHPDIHVYRPEGKLGLHSMQALKQMCSEVHLPPYEACCKIFIIHEADRMLSYSANALLKTFEEPPLHTKIILLTHSPASLLPTVRSRCAPFFFEAVSQEKIEEYLKAHYQAEESAIKSWASLAQGSIGRAVQLAKKGGDPNRTLLLNALSSGRFENFKALSAFVQQLADEIESGRKSLEDEAKELHKESSENFSALQKSALEKEIEGVSAMALAQEAAALFGVLLSWYRDLSLLQAGGDRRYLINRDYEDALEQAQQTGRELPLERVQKIIEEAQLGLQRSVSLNICLENLLLKLGLA